MPDGSMGWWLLWVCEKLEYVDSASYATGGQVVGSELYSTVLCALLKKAPKTGSLREAAPSEHLTSERKHECKQTIESAGGYASEWVNR